MIKHANIVGAGLIGGSIGKGLQACGWHVHMSDVDTGRSEAAVAEGAATDVGLHPEAEVTVVATPVGHVAEVVKQLLAEVTGVVTDVGSTKASICAEVNDPRFVGGHPMAGSEQDGLDGARSDLFAGAIWVLTPTSQCEESAVLAVRSMVTQLKADVIVLPPPVHDQLVAKVSHVPHLTAATLMNLADESAVDHQVLLRLAAGGFRDMTRISAGQPTIWPDICASNREAIVSGLDQLIESLQQVRDRVHKQDKDGLLALLTKARKARLNLPVGFDHTDSLVELLVPIRDQPGQIATIASLASELDVNIYDMEITHSPEGQRGIVILVVSETDSSRFVDGLQGHGYLSRQQSLE